MFYHYHVVQMNIILIKLINLFLLLCFPIHAFVNKNFFVNKTQINFYNCKDNDIYKYFKSNYINLII